MKILDCTLRDGGYYTNWDFNAELVSSYLKCMSNSQVDYVELGLRQFPKSKHLGPFAYTPESFLNSINLPSGPKYGVMIDAGTILKNEGSTIEESINALFKRKEDSKISLVRIAAHPDEVIKSEQILKCLNELGYLVALNIMQVSMIDSGKLSKICSLVKDWKVKPLALYFADSLGSMTSKDVNKIYATMDKSWGGAIGFHAHNNMGLALENAVECKNLGLEWLDATVTGMGRGAGNLSLEDVFLYIKENSLDKMNDIYDLVTIYFDDLKKNYKYGPTLLYRMAAKYSIHPTYIQTLAADHGVEKNTHISIIERMKNLEEPNKFSEDKYNNCLSIDFSSANYSNDDFREGNIHQIHANRDFLIIGGGKSMAAVGAMCKVFEKQRNLVTISANIKSEKYFQAHYLCATSNNALVSELEGYSNFDRKLILPKNIHNLNQKTFQGCKDFFYYGHCALGINKIEKNYFSSKCYLSGGYAIASAISMGANHIYLAGFDGYPTSDPRSKQMNNLLEYFKELHGRDKISSLTKTSCNIRSSSIFSLID